MSRPGDIAGQQVRSTNILMADYILYWGDYVLYNHGTEGPSDSAPDKSVHNWAIDGLPKISGARTVM